MANPEHLDLLRQGKESWNAWRLAHPEIIPDFADADLRGMQLEFRTDFKRGRFDRANLQGVCFRGADFECASLENTDLTGAELSKALFTRANLRRANLTNAKLYRAFMSYADLREANLTGADLSLNECSDALIHGAIFKDNQYENADMFAHYRHCNARVLLEMDGWDKVAPESLPFFNKYVADCFRKVKWVLNEEPRRKGGSDYGNETLAKYHLGLVRVLQEMYSRPYSNEHLVAAVTEINRELIAYLARHPERMRNLGDREFEKLIAELLSAFGWSVDLTRPTKDGGYDIFGIATDRTGVKQTWIVECKRWKDPVGIEIARQLYTVKNELRVGGAMLATTSDFTRGVQEFKASRYDFDLRNFDAIRAWLQTHAKQ